MSTKQLLKNLTGARNSLTEARIRIATAVKNLVEAKSEKAVLQQLDRVGRAVAIAVEASGKIMPNAQALAMEVRLNLAQEVKRKADAKAKKAADPKNAKKEEKAEKKKAEKTEKKAQKADRKVKKAEKKLTAARKIAAKWPLPGSRSLDEELSAKNSKAEKKAEKKTEKKAEKKTEKPAVDDSAASTTEPAKLPSVPDIMAAAPATGPMPVTTKAGSRRKARK